VVPVIRLQSALVWFTGLVSAVVLAMAYSVAAGSVSASPADDARSAALGRWEARAFTSYMVTLRVEALGRVCVQQVEVNNGWVRRSVRDTCDSLWLEAMSIEDLFVLAEEIEALPSSRCGPPGQPCPCHRVFTRREIAYDEELGFPTMVLARSELRYNLGSADFWQAMWERRELPSCTPARRRLTVQVLALTPIS